MIDIVLFAIATSMRLSEICRLDRPDLDTVGRTVLVRDRKHPTKKLGNHQRVPLLKGPFVLGKQVVDPMEIIARQEQRGTHLFPYKTESVSTAFTRAVKKCGIVDLHFHDLRHEGCSLLFEAGYEIQQVALCSGHQDWNMLRRYTKLKPETLHRAPAAAASNLINIADAGKGGIAGAACSS
jgi:integrase